MTRLSCALGCLLPSGSYGKRVENGASANDGSARVCLSACTQARKTESEKEQARVPELTLTILVPAQNTLYPGTSAG